MFVANILFLSIICGFSSAFAPSVSGIGTRRVASDLKMSTIQLDPSETSFVFIEYQNEFCTPGGKLHDAVKECMEKTNMLENSSKMLKIARDSGCTVIHCPISFEPGHNEIGKNP